MISFVIPAYNEEKYITETLSDLKKFTLTPSEIILSDDCSTDKTVDAARQYVNEVVSCDPSHKSTIAAARNRGAAKAKYPYLVFIDSTVRIGDPNEFFKTALSYFEKDPELVGVTVNVRVLPEAATFADNFFFGMMDQWYRLNNNILKIGMAQGKFQMVKTETFRKIGGFNEKLVAGEDIEVFGRLRKQGHTKFLPELTVYHSGRRAHAVGWPKLLTLWTINGIGTLFLKRSISKEWKAIR